MKRLLLCTLVLVSMTVCSVTAQTFRFTAIDTVIQYANRDSSYKFHVEVEHLSSQADTLVFTLTPVAYPDSNRLASICTWEGCYPPRTHSFQIRQYYEPDLVDTAGGYLIYNVVNVWVDSLQMYLPELRSLNGDYVFDVELFAVSYPDYRVTHRFTLDDPAVTAAEPRPLVGLPADHSLIDNYPNPFNNTTHIRFSVPQSGALSLGIFDITGRRVTTLIDSPLSQAGAYSLAWEATAANGLPLPTGSYFARLATPAGVVVHRILLVR